MSTIDVKCYSKQKIVTSKIVLLHSCMNWVFDASRKIHFFRIILYETVIKLSHYLHCLPPPSKNSILVSIIPAIVSIFFAISLFNCAPYENFKFIFSSWSKLIFGSIQRTAELPRNFTRVLMNAGQWQI